METKHWTLNSHLILERTNDLPGYNKWLASFFDGYFGKTTLEVGSGLGALSRHLPSSTDITLSEPREDYFNFLKKHFVKIVLRLDIEKAPPKSLLCKFDTIFSSNVFEHIKDDLKAFHNAHSLLKDDGKLLLFVPARPEIYGDLDVDMGHYRRYTKTELIQKANQSGFKVVSCFYANFPGYFLWFGRGKLLPKLLSKHKSGSDPKFDKVFSQIFDYLIVPFLYLEKVMHPPLGQSLILIAQKLVE